MNFSLQAYTKSKVIYETSGRIIIESSYSVFGGSWEGVKSCYHPSVNVSHSGKVELADEQRSERARTQVETIYRAESRRSFATLIRLVGAFDLAVLAGQLDQDADESLGHGVYTCLHSPHR
jgi:hypothetical protein